MATWHGGAASVRVDHPLRLSVYATAGDVLQHLDTPEHRRQAFAALERLRVSRVFLEGRRGDEYVSPGQWHEIREALQAEGLQGAGGIATVPGAAFGTRQDTALGWLNWESARTRTDVAAFFSENAPEFGELIVDDFFCTADMSPISAAARGPRSWGEYRRDLLVSLIEPLIVGPARAVRPDVRLILKYPQWYDRFHLFGYDPERMSPRFDQIWVGVEVRNPKTRRMGFVQPTEGYMNFRWLTSVAGEKVTGAWFDHIECDARQFVDQASQAVLAGARELTLFRLGDIMEGHPGDSLLATRLPELDALHGRIAGRARQGILFYKPPGSDAAENLYLPDYLGMLGLPILPEARFPEWPATVFLAAHAGADAGVMVKVKSHLEQGGEVVVTPAFVRGAGKDMAALAGLTASEAPRFAQAQAWRVEGAWRKLGSPLDIDAGVRAVGCKVSIEVEAGGEALPFLTESRVQQGRIFLLNVRTFSAEDFGATGEWLLAPKQLGLAELPEPVANELRRALLGSLGLHFEGPAGVGLYAFEADRCFYNFRDEPATVALAGGRLEILPHAWRFMGEVSKARPSPSL